MTSAGLLFFSKWFVDFTSNLKTSLVLGVFGVMEFSLGLIAATGVIGEFMSGEMLSLVMIFLTARLKVFLGRLATDGSVSVSILSWAVAKTLCQFCDSAVVPGFG